MNSYPIESTAKVYQDQEGNEVTLRQLIRLEPEWAHSRIKQCEKLEEQLGSLKKTIADDPAVEAINKFSVIMSEVRDDQLN